MNTCYDPTFFLVSYIMRLIPFSSFKVNWATSHNLGEIHKFKDISKQVGMYRYKWRWEGTENNSPPNLNTKSSVVSWKKWVIRFHFDRGIIPSFFLRWSKMIRELKVGVNLIIFKELEPNLIFIKWTLIYVHEFKKHTNEKIKNKVLDWINKILWKRSCILWEIEFIILGIFYLFLRSFVQKTIRFLK